MFNTFVNRHIGSKESQIQMILGELGFSSISELSETIVPKNILIQSELDLPRKKSETETIKRLQELANSNLVFRSFIGMGYYGTIIPGVIRRNVLENPGWYTQYTPYQAEISQGRLEALLNFQTMVSDLTGLPLANASLLDEGTAAAEAMVMFYNMTPDPHKNVFIVSESCHPQTIDVLKTRSEPLEIRLEIKNYDQFDFHETVFGGLVQYPDTEGYIQDFTSLCDEAHSNRSFICVATDLLALTLLKTPGEMGADAAVGNSQRFGVPMGYGGPHAAFFATKDKFKRKIPGRIIGVSKDAQGNSALRMALQTREQHIRREKATSNICTAQVLLAIISGMYAVYHGYNGLKSIAEKVNHLAGRLANSMAQAGIECIHKNFFDTVKLKVANGWQEKANLLEFNLRDYGDGHVGISFDETTTETHLDQLLTIFDVPKKEIINPTIPKGLIRTSSFLTHPVFHAHQSETEMMRYIHRLQTKDLSLTTSMIPLGSCTMKLNATTEMEPVTWPEFANIHPFAPKGQSIGYQELISELGDWLIKITGFDGISMQPNSGAQGEYSGLLLIRAFHQANGDRHRNICLIPASAHGTNPASAVLAGMKVIVIACDKHGNISKDDLEKKAQKHCENLAAVMITYPSTHGVFEHTIQEICDIIHSYGGQVYLDGANLNAMVGLCKPGEFGGDVMHINLHKTFCIPHGGGGPGMGPIVCKNHLAPFLPGHSQIKTGGDKAIHAVSAAPFGSSSILPISWAYIAMMGPDGLKQATQVAILNANYMAMKLEDHFPIRYKGISGYSAHEFIIDLRDIRKESGISDEDIAKRLMDYGFHAPTMSWPVPGTLMIEPTESESKKELDRFCNALIFIKKEIQNVIDGTFDKIDNPLKNAPHTAERIITGKWNHKYSREEAVYPAPWLREYKYWPTVGRIDNALGDRNLVCSCLPIKNFED